MKWQRTVSGASRTEIYSLDAQEIAPLVAFTELWRFVELTILPLHTNVNWDHLRIEIWAETGRFIVFPASSQSRFHIRKAVCQVVFAALLQESEAIDARFPDDDFSGEEGDFERTILEMETRWIGVAEVAARSELKGSGLDLCFYLCDDEPTQVALRAVL